MNWEFGLDPSSATTIDVLSAVSPIVSPPTMPATASDIAGRASSCRAFWATWAKICCAVGRARSRCAG